MSSLWMTTVQAGPLRKIVLYTRSTAQDSPAARSAKARASDQVKDRQNAKSSWEKLEEKLACNFGKDDLFVTLTYRDAPPTREYAQRQLKKFLALLRQERRYRNDPLIYIKNCEHLRDDGSEGRWHHHLVVNACGNDYDEIRGLWSGWGDNVDFEKLLGDGEDYGSRARYLCKERAPMGKQTWTPSRGLKRPIRTSKLVDGSLSFNVDSLPAGSRLLEKNETINKWGTFAFYKCIVPQEKPTAARSKRRGDGSP